MSPFWKSVEQSGRHREAPAGFGPVHAITALLLAAALAVAQPGADLGHDQAGRRFLEQNNWKAALAEFQQAPSTADTHIGAGIALWGMGDRKDALVEFQRAVEVNPKSPQAHYNIAIAFRNFGEDRKAAEELRMALRLDPGYEQAEIMLGLLLQQGGQPDKAVAQYQALLKRNPGSADGHNWLGVAYLQKNQFAEAEKEFREAIRLKPDYARAYNNLGSTLAQAGDIAPAIRILEQGLKYSPGDLQLRLNLGMALRSKGDAEGALAQFRSLLAEHGDSPELHYQYGQTLRQKGDLGAAVGAFEKSLELNPESREGYYGLSQALKESAARIRHGATPAGPIQAGNEALARGDMAGAREAGEKAVADDPESAEAHNLLGFALWYGGDRARATSELDQSLRLNPAAGNVYSFRGMTYRETGDLERARQMLERAIALMPDAALPYFDLGVVFLRQGHLERAVGQFETGLNLPASWKGVPDLDIAIRELRQAIGKEPDNAAAYAVLGRLLGAAGADAPEVVAAFQESIRLQPGNPETQNHLGLVYVEAGDDEKAAAAFRAAIQLRPDYADAHQNLGAVLTTTDSAEAVRELETAVKLQPAMLKAQYNLALAYEASPRHGPSKAIDEIRKVLVADAHYPRAEYALGRILMRQNKLEDALVHLRRAVDAEPGFGEARYQFGLALSRAGHAEEGAAEIRKSRKLITAREIEQAAGLDLAQAKAALATGDFDTAFAKASKVLAFRPDAAEAKAVLDAVDQPLPNLEASIRNGQYSAAEPLLRQFLGRDPNSPRAWYDLGYCLYAERKIGESIKALARSLQLDVSNAEAHKVLGRDLMIIGRFEAARVEFEQGARLSPNSSEMPYNLGKLYSIQDNWAEARRQFERALRLDADYMEARDGLGFALEALGDDVGARVNYKKAIEMNEARRAGFASPYVNMSALSNRTGDRAAALDYARKALQVSPNSDQALFQMAKALEYQGDLNGAADALTRAIGINSHAASYYYVLAGIYRKLGRQEESRKAMQEFTRLDHESNEIEEKRREMLKER